MRNARNLLSLVLAGVLALGVVACGSDSGSSGGGGSSGSSKSAGGSLNGAGATFPLPVYQEWAARFKDKTGTAVNYQGIGSGGGIAQFTAGTVDFGATDSAMKDEEIAAAKKKGDPVHVPTVFGAVTVSYNVQGLQKGLKLDGSTVADIFLGKVKTWNDPAIAQQNSGAKLPATKITVCHRSDESGTTKNFTQFLAAYSKAWESGPGSDKSVEWPTGTGAKGAYPITAATFLLVYQDVCKAGMSSGKAQSLKAWLDYAEGEGQGAAKELYYAALPDAVHTAAMAKVDGLQCNGQPIKSA
jgi:phosphate transport system substrate-binding protein